MRSPIILLLLLSFSHARANGAEPKSSGSQAVPASDASQASPAPASPSPGPAPPPSAPPKLAAADLEKIAMPIALHPDPLISIILPASAYPLEIVQAARFVRDTNNIPKVDEQPWDENVKAVAKFPDLIAKMDADLEWTMKLGQAFIDQPKELMDTIQDLRGKAQKAGTLRSTPQQVVTVTNVVVLQTNITQVVTVTNQIVQVAPANPQVVYVPSYPPTVYYPPPAYVYNPVAPLVTFGFGMAMGAIIANNCDWHGGGVWHGGGDVDIDIDRNVNRNVNRGDRPTQSGNRASSTGARSQQKWQPDQNRMRSSGAPSAATQQARGWSGASTQPAGGARPSTGGGGARPSTGNVGARPSTGGGGARPSTGTPSVNRGAAPSTASRQSPSSGSSRQASPSASSRSSGGSGGSAFGGVSSGSASRSYSNRGSTSRSGGFGGSRGGGGGRGGGGRR
jgi:hypothetical protein